MSIHNMFLSSNQKNIDTNWLKKGPYQELWEFSKIVLWYYFWQKIVTWSSHFGPHFPSLRGHFPPHLWSLPNGDLGIFRNHC